MFISNLIKAFILLGKQVPTYLERNDYVPNLNENFIIKNKNASAYIQSIYRSLSVNII